MSSTSEDNSTEALQTNLMTETSLRKLKDCREGMIRNYKDFNEKSKNFEISDFKKYSILMNVKENKTFDNDDSEDLGINEDLAILDIKH
jgi:hypothetical protein